MAIATAGEGLPFLGETLGPILPLVLLAAAFGLGCLLGVILARPWRQRRPDPAPARPLPVEREPEARGPKERAPDEARFARAFMDRTSYFLKRLLEAQDPAELALRLADSCRLVLEVEQVGIWLCRDGALQPMAQRQLEPQAAGGPVGAGVSRLGHALHSGRPMALKDFNVVSGLELSRIESTQLPWDRFDAYVPLSAPGLPPEGVMAFNLARNQEAGPLLPIGSLMGSIAALALANLRNVLECRRLAETDLLTGLPNREAFLGRLQAFMPHDRPEEFALLLLDLDRFKEANRDHGSAGGDRVLKALSGLMADQAEEREWAGRLGGDEFALVLLSPPDSLAARVARIRNAVCNRPVEMPGGGTWSLAVSGGLALCPDDGATVTTLLGRAEARLYAAMAQGGGRIVLPDPAPARG